LKGIFIDSSFFIALINERDQYHDIAVSLSNEFNSVQKYISEGIVFELSNSLVKKYKNESISLIESILTSSDVTLITNNTVLFSEAFKLYKKFPDKNWSLTDCYSFTIMNKYKIKDVLTFDKHFEQAGYHNLIRIN